MTRIEKTNEEAIKELEYVKQQTGYADTALDMAINALKQTKWIPITEKLPASDEDVLVTNGRGMYVGWIDATDKCWRVDSDSEYFMEDIVAWMPLPQPYVPDTNIGEMRESEEEK